MASTIGLGLNQVPTNGMLGGMAFQDPANVSIERLQLTSTDAVKISSGTSAERPTSSVVGMIRYNTTLSNYEVFDGFFWRLLNGGLYTDGIEYLVVAGGGGGGVQNGWWGAGGGGAGGLLTGFVPITLNRQIPVIVGAGGVGATNVGGFVAGTNGNNSVFGSLIAYGGGYGSSQTATGNQGGNGGSGGGGSGYGTPGRGILGQGNPGGDAPTENTNTTASGGGGGAATPGRGILQVNSNVGGSGGSGLSVFITGSIGVYAGGGGGGRSITGGTFGIGGFGGGGNGGLNTTTPTVTNGSVNTGGGGGGSRENTAGNGGSGIIIIRIPNIYTATFSAGVTSSLSTSVVGFKIYTVTATSTTNEYVTFT